MFCLGIDPGKKGAVAVVSDGFFSEARVWPYPGDTVSAADLIREIVTEFRPALCALEKVASMPRDGRASAFSFGRNLGAWEGILAALGLPYVYVTPQKWQRALLDSAGGPNPKTRSLAMARRLFPALDLSRKGDHGKADALHLARWALREFHGREAA